MANTLIAIPLSRTSGFAIDALVEALSAAAQLALPSQETQVHVCYCDTAATTGDIRPSLSELDGIDWLSRSATEHPTIVKALRAHQISTLIGLDFPATLASYRMLRAAGVRTLVSYMGAPSSSANRGLRLAAKRLQVALHSAGPDHYIYETEAMRASGVGGRGVPLDRTSVVPLGVDTDRFRPDLSDTNYAHVEFGLPGDRHLVFYSGHFEERKGVRVIIDAARTIVEQTGRTDIHFVLTGNRDEEATPFIERLGTGKAREFVTFAGYRGDLPRIHRGSCLGVIPSTGWDSMTMSSIEMQASGLPILVSRLQGLPETIEEGVTGRTFAVGNHGELAARILELVDQPELRARMSIAARQRAEKNFSRSRQVQSLAEVILQAQRRAATHR